MDTTFLKQEGGSAAPAPSLPVTSSSALKAAATLGLQAQKSQSGSASSVVTTMSAAIASLMAPLLQRSLGTTGTPASPLAGGANNKPPATAASSATSILHTGKSFAFPSWILIHNPWVEWLKSTLVWFVVSTVNAYHIGIVDQNPMFGTRNISLCWPRALTSSTTNVPAPSTSPHSLHRRSAL